MSIIRNFIAKQLFKKSGFIANNKAVDFSTNALIKRLNNYNIKPTDITSEDQLLRVLSSVKQAEDNVFKNRFKGMMENNKFFNRQSDNVVDLKNKKLDTEKPILGGTQETDDQILQKLKKQNEDSLNRLKNKKDPPEDMAGGGVAGLLGERTGYIHGGITHPDGRRGFFTGAQAATRGPAGGQAMSPGTSTTGGTRHGGGGSGGGGGTTTTTTTTTPKTNTGITSNYMNPTFRKATINFLNRQQPPKSFIANLKNIYGDDVTQAKTFNTMEELIGIGAAKEGLFGNKLTSEGKTLGNFMKSSKNLVTKNPNVSPSLDSVKNWMGSDVRQNTYKDYMDPNNPTQFNSTIQNAIDQGLFSDKEDFTNQVNILDLAQGGPARQNFGMGKRAFLKLMGGVGAGIAGLKSGLFGLSKGAGKKAITETVKQTAGSGTPPPYFFKLVEKIKTLGDDTLATKDKTIAKKYKDYTMEEDFAGNIEIIKKGDENLMMRDADVYMSYKVDNVPVKGKKGSTKVEEYEEYTARPDAEGKMKDIEQGVPDEVVMEVEAGGGNVPESFYTGPNAIKKADGGRIGYNKGKLVKGIISLFKKKPKKPETVKSFLDKRQFLKSMVGNTEKNKKARELKMLKEAMDEARKEGGFKFENVDIDKDIRPIFDKEIAKSLKKNRKLNATGGLANMLGE